jgi:hypothetical protein
MLDRWFNHLDCRRRRRSDRRADRPNLRRREVLARLEGDCRPFRQVVKPHAAHVSAPKRVAFAVLAEKRADSSVFPKLRDGAAHSWCPTSLRTLLLLSRESTVDYSDKTIAHLDCPYGQSTSVERLGYDRLACQPAVAPRSITADIMRMKRRIKWPGPWNWNNGLSSWNRPMPG